MQKITPFLWFDNNVEEAMAFYCSVFKNSHVVNVSPGPDGTVMSATFELDGQRLMALNGGPMFSFTPAISLFVNCETQEEVDEYWEKLSDGGSKERCGWLKDKYGLSWQVVPSILGTLLRDRDASKVNNVVQAMLQMKKLDIQGLQRAHEQVA